MQNLIIAVHQVQSGALSLAYLHQLERLDASGAMERVFLIFLGVQHCSEGVLIDFLSLTPHYIMMLAIKRKAEAGTKITQSQHS